MCEQTDAVQVSFSRNRGRALQAYFDMTEAVGKVYVIFIIELQSEMMKIEIGEPQQEQRP